MYGGLGCLGTPIVRSDAATVWATGETWWQVPPIARVTFTGILPKGVTGKDVIVALSGLFNKDEVLNHAIEFVGSEETMASLPIDARLTIANMTTEWGALSGLFPIDRTLEGWLRERATVSNMYQSTELAGHLTSQRFSHQRIDELFAKALSADRDAKYTKRLYLNLSTLAPYVSGPNSVKVATPLGELAEQNISIDKAYLVSCTNSRASDLAAAAKVFKDAKVQTDEAVKIPENVKFYIAAASMPEQIAAEEAGDWQAMLDAGAIALPAGCGPCIGPGWYAGPKEPKVILGTGEPDDLMINAEQALEKIIGQLDGVIESAEKDTIPTEAASEQLIDILPGFPEKVEGEIVFCDADNINTDGIYPGKYTYQDDVTTEKMAEVCMENFDPEFGKIARAGDILVSGFNFGCGSSREQAATAILAKRIPLVVAGSFGNIFSRNSINNALVTVEVPRLIARLREVFTSSEPSPASQQNIQEPSRNRESLDSPPPAPQTTPQSEKILTRRTGWQFMWNVRTSTVTVKEGKDGPSWTQSVATLPPNVQEIIARGGLEKWVKQKIAANSHQKACLMYYGPFVPGLYLLVIIQYLELVFIVIEHSDDFFTFSWGYRTVSLQLFLQTVVMFKKQVDFPISGGVNVSFHLPKAIHAKRWRKDYIRVKDMKLSSATTFFWNATIALPSGHDFEFLRMSASGMHPPDSLTV
ncbi:mitochondrial Homoaconitase [Lecanora helva]